MTFVTWECKCEISPFLLFLLGAPSIRDRGMEECNITNLLLIYWIPDKHIWQPTPNWQGMMKIIHQGSQHPGQSSATFLPMIDLYSGDKTCILSRLDFFCNLAMKHNLPLIVFHMSSRHVEYYSMSDSPIFGKGRYGLPCTTACGSCQTDNCDNPSNQDVVHDENRDI